jgi:hypothetical protein
VRVGVEVGREVGAEVRIEVGTEVGMKVGAEVEIATVRKIRRARTGLIVRVFREFKVKVRLFGKS